jgi:hypothetical protein
VPGTNTHPYEDTPRAALTTHRTCIADRRFRSAANSQTPQIPHPTSYRYPVIQFFCQPTCHQELKFWSPGWVDWVVGFPGFRLWARVGGWVENRFFSWRITPGLLTHARTCCVMPSADLLVGKAIYSPSRPPVCSGCRERSSVKQAVGTAARRR